MRILFDQNMPLPLIKFLVGNSVVTARAMGWAELKNGDLLRVAEDAGFDVMVTADRNMRYQQNLFDRKISLVVLPSGQWPIIELHVAEIVKAVTETEPGSYVDLRRSA